MSDVASKAVFLSYAREDFAAAQRIAEALRSHGVEVWFDQNELRGGDAWDQKIRRQIKDCALFLPVISQQTQERVEGYFRLEWKLAVERTHLMVEGVPFLAPVAVDETPDSGAMVPPEFMRVQWTRLPAALPTPQLVEQVKRLLSATRKPAMDAGRPHDNANAGVEAAAPAQARSIEMAPRGPVRHSQASRKNRLVWLLVASVSGLLAATSILTLRNDAPPAASPKRFVLSFPQEIEVVAHDKHALALSPDGKHLVFPGQRAGVTQLYDRPMDRFEATPIPGTEGAHQPFFSPNGQWVGFFAADKKIKKVTLTGGTPVPVCDVTGFSGASWGPDDRIVFGGGGGLFWVSAAGGSPQVLAAPDSKQAESDYHYPDILPGGQAILFTIWTGGYARPQIAVHSLKTGQRRVLLDGMYPRFVPSGYIVFVRAGSLWAVPFALDRLEITGSPAPVVEGVHLEWGVWPYFTVAADGTLAYVPGALLDAKRLVWVDRKGAIEPLNLPPRSYDNPRLSPDGQRLLIVCRGENPDVWTHELARGTLTRLTADPGEDETPVWMPDGKRLMFAGNRSGGSQLFAVLADRSGLEEELLGTRGGHRHAHSVSPDGEVLAFEEITAGTGNDIWVMALQGERKARPFLRTAFNETAAKFSPDGRWIAYSSDESGRSEIYVQPYPGPGGKRQISAEGGTEPVWAHSRRELFYRNGDKMMVVDVALQPTFSASQQRVLFEGRFDTLPWNSNYDVTPDDQRFLMVQSAEPGTGQTRINVVLNWFEELKRRVPPK